MSDKILDDVMFEITSRWKVFVFLLRISQLFGKLLRDSKITPLKY